MLLISSDMDELVEGSDRVIVLKDGTAVAELTGTAVTEENLLRAMATDPAKSDA